VKNRAISNPNTHINADIKSSLTVLSNDTGTFSERVKLCGSRIVIVWTTSHHQVKRTDHFTWERTISLPGRIVSHFGLGTICAPKIDRQDW
jgi:hypothetical protein